MGEGDTTFKGSRKQLTVQDSSPCVIPNERGSDLHCAIVNLHPE